MQEVNCKGLPRIDVRDKQGNGRKAVLELRYRRIHILPTIWIWKRYPALNLTVIHAQERDPLGNGEAIDWKLITDMPVHSRAEAMEKIDRYALCWKIEAFHKIMKSGCKRKPKNYELQSAW